MQWTKYYFSQDDFILQDDFIKQVQDLFILPANAFNTAMFAWEDEDKEKQFIYIAESDQTVGIDTLKRTWKSFLIAENVDFPDDKTKLRLLAGHKDFLKKLDI